MKFQKEVEIRAFKGSILCLSHRVLSTIEYLSTSLNVDLIPTNTTIRSLLRYNNNTVLAPAKANPDFNYQLTAC